MSGETAKWLRAAWIVLAIVGVLDLAFGFWEEESLLIVLGFVFLGCAYYARRGSLGALGLALALLAIDTVVTILEVGATWLWGVRLLILYVVLSAFLQLRAERRVTSAAGGKIAE